MLDYTQLEALLAVKREGSFEKAGKALGISPIAIARRVEKLGVTLGATLLSRKPTRPTEAGEALCAYAEQIEAVERSFIDEHRMRGLRPNDLMGNANTLKIAINDDSVTSWFQQVLKDHLHSREFPYLDICVVDPDHTMELIKSGELIAAMSWAKQPIDGFRVYHLGCIVHRAVASSDFIERYFKNGVTVEAAGASPSLRYNNQDGSVLQWIEQVWETTAKTLSTCLPCQNVLMDSCLRGSVWAVLPDQDIRSHLEDGILVELIPDTPLQKDLYWHVSSTMAEPIAGLTSSVRKAARAHLLAKKAERLVTKLDQISHQ